jgi:hypothetical protein
VILISGLFLFISAPFSNASESVVDVSNPVSNESNIDALLGSESGIAITAATVATDQGVYTFSGFNPAITSEYVQDPESYVINISGILLKAEGSYNDNSTYAADLENVIIDNLVTDINTGMSPTVVDVGAISFDFTVSEGHNTISLDFILASGEYYDGDWDIAGIFINDVNYAFLPNGNVLRVNSDAQITNVCSIGSPGGCYVSDYSINGDVLGTLSPKLTLYAPINEGTSNNFTASVANTSDDILPSYLLLSNFNSFTAAQSIGESAFTSSFILNDVEFDFGIQIDTPYVNQPSPRFYSMPNQSSEITGISISTADANNVTIIVTGKFIEKVLAIDVNDRRVLTDAWEQTSTSITLTVPAVASGIYAVQIWNGSFPTLQSQTVLVTTK